jgi:hypothetical protein
MEVEGSETIEKRKIEERTPWNCDDDVCEKRPVTMA